MQLPIKEQLQRYDLSINSNNEHYSCNGLFILFLIFLPFINYSQEINLEVLNKIKEEAIINKTSALIIYSNDSIITRYYDKNSQKKISCMSITKSIISLGIGILLDKGLLKSIDSPVTDFYPDYKGNYKQEITIRHLLEHTSGIKTQNNTARILLSSNKIRHALNSSIVSKPGTKFVYNNNAVNVLSGIIEKASGQKADSFINTYLFKPLNITDYSWAEDKAGNPTAYAGLDLLPEDLAKIGLLLLHDGKWNGQQIISKQWIKESTSSSKISEKWAYPTGFLWWCERDIVSFKIRESVFDSIKKIGVDTLIVSKLNKLREKEIPVNEFEPLLKHTLGHDYKYFREILKEYNLQLMKIILGKTIGFSAEGWLGQWLIVIPEKKIVAVRMIDLKNAKKFGNTNFYNFLRLVPKLK